jgi:hypothetical protein
MHQDEVAGRTVGKRDFFHGTHEKSDIDVVFCKVAKFAFSVQPFPSGKKGLLH